MKNTDQNNELKGIFEAVKDAVDFQGSLRNLSDEMSDVLNDKTRSILHCDELEESFNSLVDSGEILKDSNIYNLFDKFNMYRIKTDSHEISNQWFYFTFIRKILAEIDEVPANVINKFTT